MDSSASGDAFRNLDVKSVDAVLRIVGLRPQPSLEAKQSPDNTQRIGLGKRKWHLYRFSQNGMNCKSLQPISPWLVHIDMRAV